MKKSTLLLTTLMTITTTIGQNTANAESDINTKNLITAESFILSSKNSANGSIEIFDDEMEFFDNCIGAASLTFEDFDNGPDDGVIACGSSVSSSGDSCFAAGEIQEDIEFTNNFADSNSPMVYFDGNGFGVFDPGIGPDAFAAYMIINFSGETSVNSIAFDLYSPLGDGALTEIRLFGSSGLIDSFIVNVLENEAFFVGVLANEDITSMEIENQDGVIELVTQFYFGDCDILNLNDNSISNINIYPNPISDILSIDAIEEIEAVSIYNTLGQKVMSSSYNVASAQINTSSLGAGIYLIKVLINGKTSTYKVIKK